MVSPHLSIRVICPVDRRSPGFRRVECNALILPSQLHKLVLLRSTLCVEVIISGILIVKTVDRDARFLCRVPADLLILPSQFDQIIAFGCASCEEMLTAVGIVKTVHIVILPERTIRYVDITIIVMLLLFHVTALFCASSGFTVALS